jgi:hypothetical protein
VVMLDSRVGRLGCLGVLEMFEVYLFIALDDTVGRLGCLCGRVDRYYALCRSADYCTVEF